MTNTKIKKPKQLKILDHIELAECGLSIRAYNSLWRAGINTLYELINIPIKDIKSVKNLGRSSFKEVKDILKYWNSSNITKIYNYIHNNNLNGKDESIEHDIITVISDNFKKDNKELDIKSTIIEILITNALSKKNMSLSELNENVPEELGPIIDVLNNMICDQRVSAKNSENKILYTTTNQSVRHYVNSMKDGRDKDVLKGRLSGKTLDQIGREHGITRERIRQIEAKVYHNMPKLREDDYKYLFQEYDWSLDTFQQFCNKDVYVYNYLLKKYKRGHRHINELVDDLHAPNDIKTRMQKYLNIDTIIINNTRLDDDKYAILDYIVKTQCKNETDINELKEYHKTFLKEHNLIDDKYQLSEINFKYYVDTSETILKTLGQAIRYYDFDQITSSQIAKTLKLNELKDVEYSTLKFFRDYPDTMDKWDIRNEYELHNLIKKVVDCEKYNINVERMPTIQFGDADRHNQIQELLLEHSPISGVDLAGIYEDVYGTLSNTIQINHLDGFNEYLYGSIYNMVPKKLNNKEMETMKNLLTKDVYRIVDVENIYKSEFPKGNYKNINPYNMRKLGFKMRYNVIFSNKYSSFTEYLKDEITKNDIFDPSKLESWITSQSGYYTQIRHFCDSFEILETTPKIYTKRNKLEIQKEDLLNYIEDVYNFVDDEIFTLKSIKNKGFYNKLEELGYDDCFYNNLLISKKDFRYRNLTKATMFKKGSEPIELTDLVEQILKDHPDSDILSITHILKSEYGINTPQNQLSLSIKNPTIAI